MKYLCLNLWVFGIIQIFNKIFKLVQNFQSTPKLFGANYKNQKIYEYPIWLIDTCYLKSPINTNGNSNIIYARITNNSLKNEEDISINLKINNKHKTQQITSLLSNESKEIELSFTSVDESHLNGVISIEDHPITFDNKIYFSINVNSEIKVCQISDSENTYIKKIYENEENIVYTSQNINQLDYNLLSTQDLIILNNILHFSSGLIDFLETYVT